MCNIKLKVQDGDKGLELEMVDYKESALKYVLDRLSVIIGGDPAAGEEEKEEEQYIEPVDLWRKGYQELMSEEHGLHDPGSEYTVPNKSIDEVAVAVAVEPEPPKKAVNYDFPDNKKQLWYICECGNKKKEFVPAYFKYICCDKCSSKMMIRWANSQGPEHADEFGNHFIAGEFRKTMKDKEVEDKFWDRNAG